MKIYAQILGLSLIIGGCIAGLAIAQEKTGEEKLREAMALRAPDMPITSITESVLPGIYELISGGQVYYLSPDARFLVDGSIIDLESKANISEERRGGLQLALINAIPEEQMVVFNNESGTAERSITVFTDSDCGYCRKLHEEVDLITGANIKVRYLLYPRAGIGSSSAKDLENVWCADDQQEAMTIAKQGGSLTDATCSNPIESHLSLGREVGLRGTPLIYLDNGTKVPGYRPASDIIEMIENSTPLATK